MKGLKLGLFSTFFAASWLSNLGIIRTTTHLLQNSSPELILAVSSVAGIAFFILLRILARIQRPTLAAWLMLPAWAAIHTLSWAFPDLPVWPAMMALLFGELAKWHAYSQVLQHYGPLSAGRVLERAVLAYELGTIAAALSGVWAMDAWWWGPFEVLALAGMYLPFFINKVEETSAAHSAGPAVESTHSVPVPWLVVMGMMAGFLKVSADTGFKFAIGHGDAAVGTWVAKFYFLSAGFTAVLWLLRRTRWLSLRLGGPKASLLSLTASHGLFAVAMLLGSVPGLVLAAAFQRSVDKIFYQPTLQLLTAGFAPVTQEKLRGLHATAFLGLGSLLGFTAFMAHGLLDSADKVLLGMSVLHVVMSLVCVVSIGLVIKSIVVALDHETRLAGKLGSSRPMAMLALLSPRHFLVHALVWSSHRGGMQTLPTEILQGLSSEAGGEVVESFYLAYARMDEAHQMALIRLAVLLDRPTDHAFLLTVASEAIGSCLRPKRLAAIHVVKIHGKMYRPLLRRARGKKSPLPHKLAA